MKNYLLIIILSLFSLINFANSEEKISIIDMEYLLENSIAGKSIKTKLEKINKKNAQFFKKKEKELKDKEDKIIKQKNVISKEEYVKIVSSFQKEVQAYKKEKSQRANKIKQIKVTHINELLKKLSPIIAKFSKDNNISIVLDKKFTIVSKIESDITKKLLKVLDSEVKKIDLK